jgi:hypothetical protein
MTTSPVVAPCPSPSSNRRDLDRKGVWRRVGLLAVSATALTTAGCGGGGSNSAGFLPIAAAPAPAVAPAPAPPASAAPAPAVATTMTGVVAAGAAFAGAKLSVVDSTGAIVCSVTVEAAGTYICELAATVKPPLVISALRDDVALYSVTAGTTGGTVNVTPITTIIAARLAPNGDPAQLATGLAANPGSIDAAKIQAQVTQVLLLLKPLLEALGDTVDPITGRFAANGTGHDRVLDTISVSVRPDGTASNIEVTVRSIPAGASTAPIAISFRSSDANPPALPAIAAASLPQAGVSPAIADLMARATACYALPLSERVTASDNSVAVVGTAADVRAAACKAIFYGDDPASFKSNGLGVGRSAANVGAFSGLFRPGAANVKFKDPEIGYYLSNGDILITYLTLDSAGNVSNNSGVVRTEGALLKFIGNQFTYSSSISPSVQARDFVNAPSKNYYNVGYDIGIDNVTVAGVSIFTKVLVTAPDGTVYTMVPTAGNNSLRLKKPDGTVTTTSIIRLNAAFNSPGTAGHPSTMEPSLVYASPLLNDAQIGALPDNGAWTFEFFHADLATPNVTQTVRTLQRVPTLAEASLVKLTKLSDGMRAFLVDLTAQTRYIIFGGPPSATAPNTIGFGTSTVPGWTVPTLAVAPTNFAVYGNAPPVNNVTGPAFDDRADLAAGAQTAYLTCSPASIADTHCDSSTGITQYAQFTSFNYFQLTGRNAKQTIFLTGIATYVP